MKRGISVHADYDRGGRWYLAVEKAKGRLTLDEILDAAREYGADHYLLHIDAVHDPDDIQYGEEPVGDVAILYRSDVLFEEV